MLYINIYRNSNKCYKELSHFVQAAASSRWFRQAELVIAFFFFITFSSNVIYLQVYILRSQKTKRDLLPDHAQITHNGFKSYLKRHLMFFKGSLISEGILTLVPLPKKSAKIPPEQKI